MEEIASMAAPCHACQKQAYDDLFFIYDAMFLS
jgi:hypothetical protein